MRFYSEADVARIAENENPPDRRSSLGWVFLVVTLLALGYWIARRVFPAIRDAILP